MVSEAVKYIIYITITATNADKAAGTKDSGIPSRCYACLRQVLKLDI